MMILKRFSRLLVRRCRAVLALSLVGLVGASVVAANLSDHLKLEMFVDHRSEAYRGRQFLEQNFGIGSPNFLLLMTVKSGSVDDAPVAAEAEAVVRRLRAEPGVADVASYWSLGRPAHLRSERGNRAVVMARILGDDKTVDNRVRWLQPRYHLQGGAIDTRVGGSADAYREMTDAGVDELKRAEMIVVPLTLVALLVIFGSVVAALLPLAMAAFAVLGTAVVLWTTAMFTDVSKFALLFTTVLAMGLGVDYSLFMVNRFREELAGGHDPGSAVVRTVQTAGRTVLFSSAAVMVSNAALLTSPLAFMRSFGFAGMGTAAMAGLAAVVVLPALLALLGTKVNRGAIRPRSIRAQGSGFWRRIAQAVMRRPVVVAATVVVVLLVAASPLLHLKPVLVDDRQLPRGTAARDTADILRSEFDAREATPISVVVPGANPSTNKADIDVFARRLAAVRGVAREDTTSGADSTYFNVITHTEPLSPASEGVIDAIRRLPSPFPSVLVTGEAANAYDVKDAILRSLPAAFIFIVLATFIMLFLQFGSLLVPLKAVALNVLSLSAIFGGLVWVFQEGHFASLLGFTATNSLYINLPIIIFCVAFGLSMDYEVFLLSRIKEEYDRSSDNEASVALGLQRSGPIVSAAAMLIAVVFLTTGFLGSTMFSKAFGLGLGAVVLLDAFVIRCTLVPALMKIAGAANWWAPQPLRRLHERVHLTETIELEPAESVPGR